MANLFQYVSSICKKFPSILDSSNISVIDSFPYYNKVKDMKFDVDFKIINKKIVSLMVYYQGFTADTLMRVVLFNINGVSFKLSAGNMLLRINPFTGKVEERYILDETVMFQSRDNRSKFVSDDELEILQYLVAENKTFVVQDEGLFVAPNVVPPVKEEEVKEVKAKPKAKPKIPVGPGLSELIAQVTQPPRGPSKREYAPTIEDDSVGKAEELFDSTINKMDEVVSHKSDVSNRRAPRITEEISPGTGEEYKEVLDVLNETSGEYIDVSVPLATKPRGSHFDWSGLHA